jgi:hypothetical protein
VTAREYRRGVRTVTPENAAESRRLYATGLSIAKTGHEVGLSESTVWKLVSGIHPAVAGLPSIARPANARGVRKRVAR